MSAPDPPAWTRSTSTRSSRACRPGRATGAVLLLHEAPPLPETGKRLGEIRRSRGHCAGEIAKAAPTRPPPGADHGLDEADVTVAPLEKGAVPVEADVEER